MKLGRLFTKNVGVDEPHVGLTQGDFQTVLAPALMNLQELIVTFSRILQVGY